MSSPTHIIHRVSVEVQTNSAETSSFKEEMDRLIQDAILSSIESYIVEHESEYEEQSIQIEKLSLDLQLDSLKHNQLDISTQVYQQMDALFSHTSTAKGGRNSSIPSTTEQSRLDVTNNEEPDIIHLGSFEKNSKTFFHFLRYGTLPWWIPDSTRMTTVVNDEKLLELIYEQNGFVQQLKKELKSGTSKLRLIQQFSDETLLCVFTAVSAEAMPPNKLAVLSFFKGITRIVQQFSQTERKAFWLLVSEFSSIQQQAGFPRKVLKAVNHVFNTYTASNTEKNSLEEESIFHFRVASLICGITSFNSIQEPTVEDYINTTAIPLLEASGGMNAQSSSETDSPSRSKEESSEVETTETENSLNQDLKNEAAKMKGTDEDGEENTSSPNHENQSSAVKKKKVSDTEAKSETSRDSHQLEKDIETTKDAEGEEAISQEMLKAQESSKKDDSIHNQQNAERTNEIENKHADEPQSIKEPTKKDDFIHNQQNAERKDETENKKADELQSVGEPTKKDNQEVDSSTAEIRENQKGLETPHEITTSDAKTKENEESSSDSQLKSQQSDKESAHSNSTSESSEESNVHPNEDYIKGVDGASSNDQPTSPEVQQLLKGLDQPISAPFKESFIAENAGVILLHPFLKAILTKLELLDGEGGLTDPEFTAHLLHYASTGEEMEYEYSMTFEKFLCGISPDYVLQRKIELSDETKQNVDELLGAVLTHWTALKSNSIALLRNEFLKRQGKVVLDDSNPRIVFERKTIDIMLDRLPWNMSIIKLPWRDELLYVEW